MEPYQSLLEDKRHGRHKATGLLFVAFLVCERLCNVP